MEYLSDGFDLVSEAAATMSLHDWLGLLGQTGAVGLLLVLARLGGRGLLWATRRPLAWSLALPGAVGGRAWRLAFPRRSPTCETLLAVLNDPGAIYDPAAGKLLAGTLLVEVDISGAVKKAEAGAISFSEATLGRHEWDVFTYQVRCVVNRLEAKRLADLEADRLRNVEKHRQMLSDALKGISPGRWI